MSISFDYRLYYQPNGVVIGVEDIEVMKRVAVLAISVHVEPRACTRVDEIHVELSDIWINVRHEVEVRDLQNVTLHGLVEDIPSFLAECDIYFQPSRWEGLCITALEAMAAGLPVVGSNVGSIGRNVKASGSGFLYEPHDVDGFVTGIKTLVEDPELRQRFGEQSRETVGQNFTKKVLVDEFKRAISTD